MAKETEVADINPRQINVTIGKDVNEHTLTYTLVPNDNNVSVEVTQTQSGTHLLTTNISGAKRVYNSIAKLIGTDKI